MDTPLTSDPYNSASPVSAFVDDMEHGKQAGQKADAGIVLALENHLKKQGKNFKTASREDLHGFMVLLATRLPKEGVLKHTVVLIDFFFALQEHGMLSSSSNLMADLYAIVVAGGTIPDLKSTDALGETLSEFDEEAHARREGEQPDPNGQGSSQTQANGYPQETAPPRAGESSSRNEPDLHGLGERGGEAESAGNGDPRREPEFVHVEEERRNQERRHNDRRGGYRRNIDTAPILDKSAHMAGFDKRGQMSGMGRMGHGSNGVLAGNPDGMSILPPGAAPPHMSKGRTPHAVHTPHGGPGHAPPPNKGYSTFQPAPPLEKKSGKFNPYWLFGLALIGIVFYWFSSGPTNGTAKEGGLDRLKNVFMADETALPGDEGMSVRKAYFSKHVLTEKSNARGGQLPVLSNPVARSWDNIHDGRTVYDKYCGECHGTQGLGGGALAASLNTRPPSLKFAGDGLLHKAEYLFWTISEGGEKFSTDMPSFQGVLTEQEIWKVILFLGTVG
ncbi:MAG: cytochrome c [Magnetococcales bacterium]|nr:cytochrome c [Magnetococcales bacterium]